MSEDNFNIKSIVAENHLSIIQFFGLLLLGLVVIIAVLFDGDFDELLFVLPLYGMFLYFGYKEINSCGEFVSNIEIDSENLTLIYKDCGKISRKIRIGLNEIEKFHLNVSFNPSSYGGGGMSLVQRVDIKTSFNEYAFEVLPTVGVDFRVWSFTLRLLEISKYIPNFSYSVDTNKKGEFIKKDIEFFILNNKKYPYWKLIANDLGISQGFVLFFIVVILGGLILSLGSILIEKMF